MSRLTESVVEDAGLAWLESLGWTVRHGPDIAPGELAAERSDYGQVVLADRLRQALARLNPALPPEALEDAFRKLARPEGPTLEARNRALHRLLVDPSMRERHARTGWGSAWISAGRSTSCIPWPRAPWDFQGEGDDRLSTG